MITSTTDVIRKNRARLMRIPPRYRRAPRIAAVRIPSSAPRPAASWLSAAWNAASRNTAVSRPSRRTAKNAIATSANTEPVARAAAA
jgi:hypothetical protein